MREVRSVGRPQGWRAHINITPGGLGLLHCKCAQYSANVQNKKNINVHINICKSNVNLWPAGLCTVFLSNRGAPGQWC